MLNKKAIKGLLESPPQKRYRSFLNTVADLEKVFAGLEIGKKVFVTNNDGAILLWPYKEFCELMLSSNQLPHEIEIHDFLKYCSSLDNSTMFSIFPTSADSYTVSAEQLILDIQEHLDEVE